MFVVAVASLLCAQSFGQSRICTIKMLIGDVKIRRGSAAVWIDAKPRMRLAEKDAIRTFVESEAELETSEGSIIRIGENSTIELSSLQGGKDVQKTKVKILNGNVVSNIKKILNTKSSFDFETPTALASIRGTVVGFEVTGEKTRIKVYEGNVLVFPLGSNKGTELHDNQMTSVAKGQTSIEVTKLEEKAPAGILDSALQKADSAKTPSDSGDSSLSGDSASALALTVSSPKDGAYAPPSDYITISGSVSPLTASVEINGKSVTTGSGGTFTFSLAAPSNVGEFIVTITARSDDKVKTVTRTVMLAAPSLDLAVSTPVNGQQFNKPLIPVSGKATAGAEVTVTPPGVRIPIMSNGAFSTQAPLPDEEGEYTVEIEAVYGSGTQRIIRKVMYKPECRFVIVQPVNRQTVTSTIITVTGEVNPVKGAEITVQGRRMTIRPDGTFSGMITIPDQEGEVQLDFDVYAGGKSQTITRTIVYKRAVDTYAPVIQGNLPKYAKQRQICLPVYDRTPDDEITFYYEIDGARDYQKGSSNSSFCFNLEPGIHAYAVWSEDRMKNQSQRLTEKIAYVETSAWYIKMRKPAGEEVIRLPPSPPERQFDPTYVVDFSIENLPGDDMRLVREVRVLNQATGKSLTQSVFTDHYLDFEIALKPRSTNIIVIEVQDCNGNKKVQQAVIHLR